MNILIPRIWLTVEGSRAMAHFGIGANVLPSSRFYRFSLPDSSRLMSRNLLAGCHASNPI